jgi:hypothetical protein
MCSAAYWTVNNKAPPFSTLFSLTRRSQSFKNKNIVSWSTKTYLVNADEHREGFVGQGTRIEIRFYRRASKWTANSAIKALCALSTAVLMILFLPCNGMLEIFESQAYVYTKLWLEMRGQERSRPYDTKAWLTPYVLIYIFS